MSDSLHSRSHARGTDDPRGQSFVEFALVLPMLLVLLLGIADFGRVFQAGIVMESAARNAAEAAAQEYLQIRRSSTPATGDDFNRIRSVAEAAVCEEADLLPVERGGDPCDITYAAVCIHDDPAELASYGSGCGGGGSGAPAECDDMHASWPSHWAPGNLGSVEVRVCYRFDTIVPMADLRLPFGNGLNLGTLWLERSRVFAVADY